MTILLKQTDFVNGRFTVAFGNNREALFIMVDEEFQGNNNIGRVNKIVIIVRDTDANGSTTNSSMQSSVIGLGNRIVGVQTSVPELRGQVLSKDNMEQCAIILYEDE